MKDIFKNSITVFVFITIILIDIGTGNYASLVSVPLCFILVYYNHIKNIEANATLQQLFVENSEHKLKLMKSDSELSTFFKITPSILAIATLGQYKRVSDNFVEALGYTKDEIIDHSFFDFVHPEDIQKTLDIVKQSQEDVNAFDDFINRCRAKDGRYVTIKWKAILVDGIFYASGNDITKELLLTEKLETNEYKFRRLFEKINTPLCIFDKELFLFSSVNYAFASRLGYVEEEMTDKHLSEFIYEEDLTDSFEASQAAVKTQGYENRYVCKNGGIKELRWSTLGDDERFVYCTAEFLN